MASHATVHAFITHIWVDDGYDDDNDDDDTHVAVTSVTVVETVHHCFFVHNFQFSTSLCYVANLLQIFPFTDLVLGFAWIIFSLSLFRSFVLVIAV